MTKDEYVKLEEELSETLFYHRDGMYPEEHEKYVREHHEIRNHDYHGG